MLKKITAVVLSLTMVFSSAGYLYMNEKSSALDNESSESNENFISPYDAYLNSKDKSYFYKVKYNSVYDGPYLGTYIAHYMSVPQLGITKDKFDEENPERVLKAPEEEGDPVIQSMMNADKGADIMNFGGNVDNIKYGFYNKITKKFVSKKDMPIKFMEERDVDEIQYPDINEGETKKIRLVYNDEYWLGKITKNQDKYKISFYLVTEEKYQEDPRFEESKVINTYDYKISDQTIIKDDSEEKNLIKNSNSESKIEYKLKEAEFNIPNLNNPISIKRIKTSSENNKTTEENMSLMIDPTFDDDYTDDTIGLKQVEITGYPLKGLNQPYTKKIEDLFLKDIYNNSEYSENTLSFRKDGGYNVEDDYRYTIDGSEPTKDSKELFYFLEREYKDKSYSIKFNGEKNELGKEKIDSKYLDGGKLTLKVRSFRDGKPNSDTFTYTLNINKKSFSANASKINIKFNNITKKSEDANLGLNAYLFNLKAYDAIIYYDTKVKVDKINISDNVISRLNEKKIGRYYPVSINLLDKDDNPANIPYGWDNEQLKVYTEGKSYLSLKLLNMTQSEISPVEINEGNKFKLYELKEDGNIQEVVDDYNDEYFKYGIKLVNGKLNIKVPIEKASSKFIIAEENSYINDIETIKNKAKEDIDKLSNLSNEEKTAFKNKINNATTKESIEAIVKEAKDANDKKNKNSEVYSVPVKMVQAYAESESMGNNALVKKAVVRKKDNKYVYEISFSGMKFMNMYGHLWGLSVYDGNFDSSKKAATVIKKFMDKDLQGNQREFPKTYSFEKGDKENTVNVEVEVDAMDAIKNGATNYDDIKKGAGKQKARLIFDWSKAETIKDDEDNSGKLVTRLAGKDRYETAIKISRENFESANTVVLASGVNSADALASSSFATSKSAPILLTKKKSLEKNVLDEIKRLNAKSVIVVGGTESVSGKVISKIKDEGIDAKRISGEDRYETSREIAKELLKSSDNIKEAVLVNGYKNVDALSVSSLATKENIPIIMNDSKRLNRETKKILENSNIKKVYIIGGKDSLSNRIEKNIKAIDLETERLAGRDRYETSSKIAKHAYNTSNKIIIASGENSIDALAAGVLTKKEEAPMLLVEKNRVPKSILNRIEESKSKKSIIVGGEKTVTEKVKEKIVELLK